MISLKKIKLGILSCFCVGLLFSLLLSLTAFAQTFDVYYDHTYDYTFLRNDPSRDIGPILIIDRNGSSIKAQKGLNFMIPAGLFTLWEKNVTQVTASGTAVTNGKMDVSIVPVYSEDLKIVFIPVEGDFARDEEVRIEGLKMRVYRNASSRRFIELDLDGDKISDVPNFRSIAISDELRTDATAPYPVTALNGVYADSKVTLTWKDPVDPDLERIFIERTVERSGQTSTDLPVEVYATEQQYVDVKVQEGDKITYKVQARDSVNMSDPVVVTVEARIPVPEIEATEEDTPVDTEEEISDEEAEVEEEVLLEKLPLLDSVTETDTLTLVERFPEIPPSHWGLKAMAYLTLKESVFSGYGDGTLRIDQSITRAELAKIAWHAFINQFTPVVAILETPFSDILSNHWFLPYVKAMNERNVVKGYGDGTFRPLDKVKRVEALSILLKSAKIEVPEISPEEEMPFSDVQKGVWYTSYVVFAHKNGFIQGYSDGTFHPGETATRAQIAIITMKIKDYLQGIRN